MMEPLRRTQRSETLAATVADSLRQALQDGVYGPQEYLAELVISQEMGISQAVARDALYQLEREGWITRRARRRAVVRSFSAGEAAELFGLWAEVAALGIGWVLQTLPRGDLMALLNPSIENAQTQINVSQNPLAPLMQFHYGIVEALRLARKAQTADLLLPLCNGAYLVQVKHRADLPYSAWVLRVRQYTQLAGIIKFGDVESAQTALRQQILLDNPLF
jgi:DNA-binding GntR family transcriptional regulator